MPMATRCFIMIPSVSFDPPGYFPAVHVYNITQNIVIWQMIKGVTEFKKLVEKRRLDGVNALFTAAIR